MKVTEREIALAVALAALGLTLNSVQVLRFLATLNPIEGFAFYEFILFCSLMILSHFDLVVFGIKIKSITQTVGLWIVTFSFFLAVDMTSQWVQYATTGSLSGMSNVYLQSEDGSSFYAISSLTPWLSPQIHYYLTFGVFCFITALIGGALASKKPRF